MTLLRVPKFYPEFRCVGSACSDNCCIGWEINIDPKTLTFYKSVQGPLGERLSHCIRHSQFVLAPGDRCPFLNEHNLCDIYTELGKSHLSEVCAEHPRFVEACGDLVERGISLCCEEGVRLLFKDEAPLEFVTFDSMEPPEPLSEEESNYLEFVLNFRERAFAVLRAREVPFAPRVQHLLLMTAEECKIPLERPTISVAELRTKWLDLLSASESISPEWDAALLKMRKGTFQSPKVPDFEYEHWVVYLLFRYSLKAVYEGALVTKVQFAVFCFWVLRELDAALWEGHEWTLADRIVSAKLLSKQLEYSENNLELLEEAFENDMDFGLGAMGMMV